MSLWKHLLLLLQLIKCNPIEIVQPCHYYNKTLPLPLEQHQMAYFEDINTAYIFGGETCNRTLCTSSSNVYKWNISNKNSWFELIKECKTPSMFRAYINNVVVIENHAYFIGLDTHDTHNIHVFDYLTDSFIDTNLSEPLFPDHYGCIITNETHIFMLGGFHNILLQIYGIDMDKWVSEKINISIIASLQGFYGQFCQLMNDTLFVFGGMGTNESHNYVLNDYYKYELKRKQWTHLGTMPGTTTFGATVRYDSNIFLVGGTNNYYIPRSLTNIEIFNAHTEQFEHSYYMIDGVYLFPALLLDNVLYILGGAGDLPRATVQVCDVHLRSKHLDGG
eukprot:515793_1